MKTTEIGSDQLLSALKPVLERLLVVAGQDPTLRAELRHLGEILLAVAAEPHPLAVTNGESLVTTSVGSTSEPIAVQDAPAHQSTEGAKSPLPLDAPDHRPMIETPSAPLSTAPSSTPQPASKPAFTPRRSQPWLIQPVVQSYSSDGVQSPPLTTTLDFGALVQNCTLKKEAAVWAAERQQRVAQGNKSEPDVEAQRLKLIETAQSRADCFLWMCQREAPADVTATAYEELAGCFEATTQIVLLLEPLVSNDEEDEPFLEPALTLAAEAQAALRNAISAVNGTVDSDQVKLFQWLKAMTYYHQIHIREYMSKWNSAQPAAWAALKARIQELADRVQEFKQLSRQRQKLFSKVRHRCRVIESAVGEERLEDWQRLAEVVSGLIDSGLPPSNIELRDYLLPILEQLPIALVLPKNFQLVLREIDRFLANRAPVSDEFEVTAPIAEVQRVRELLQGQTVVLIGGERRQAAAAALSSAFALKELIWIEGHDQTYTDFEPHVARSEVAIVLLAIRWSRHGFGEVKEFCTRYDKPLVRLLGGYNPNQVAYTILSQIGQRLLQPIN